MNSLALKLLGRPEVSCGGKALEFRSRREQGLLFYLATEGGLHEREKLAEFFWPRSRGSRAALRTALASLKKTLRSAGDPESEYVVSGRDLTVGFDPSLGAQLDLNLLEAVSTPIPSARTEEERRSALEELEAAARAYRGEFLEGFSLEDAPDFDYWVGVERERWRRRAETALERLSTLQLGAGRTAEAGATAERWTEISPASEAAGRRLMEARFAAGDQTGALRAYEALRGVFADGLEPETEALAASVRTEASSGGARRRMVSARGAIEAPLVGRSEEFETLVWEYHAVREGGARAVLVVGEAGIGKTRLVSEFLAWARAESADVLAGAAFEASARLPYGPVVGALRERLDRERAPDDLLGDVWLSELSRILPEIRDRYPDLPVPTADETSARTRLFEAASALVAAFAERSGPVVFFVDDLQWADAATLDFLRYAARRWTEDAAPVLLVANLRAEAFALDPRLAGWWTGVSRDLPARRVALDSLDREATLRLLGALAGANPKDEQTSRLERLGRWLHAETGGQPFFLTETLGTLVERGVLAPDAEGGPALGVAAFEEEALRNLLPARVRDLLRARIGNLGSAAAELLSAAAVLGGVFGFERVCRVAGLGESECLPALDEALAGGLLRENDGHPGDTFGEESYAFVHDRMRDVAYTEAGSARRRLFHRRALEVLTENEAPAAELARHAFAGGLAGDAFDHSLAAGDQALALFATEDAVSHYERAEKLTVGVGDRPPSVDPPDTGLERLYVNLGRAHELAGRWDEARAAYEAMRTRGRDSGRPRLELSALGRLAILAAQRSFDAPAAVGLLERALEIAGAGGDRLGVAEVEWNLSQMHAHNLEVSAAIAHGERALRLAREQDLKELEARTLVTLATAHSFGGRWKECAVHAREGAALYAALDDSRAETGALSAQYILAGSPPSATASNRAMRVQCLCLLSGGEVHCGSPQAGVEAGREGLEISRRLNNEWTLAHIIADLTQGLLDVGEYEEALGNAREGVEVARTLPIPNLFFFTLVALGNTHQALLDLEGAREAYAEAEVLIEATSSHGWKAFLAPHLCANRALAGDWVGAHAYAGEAVAARKEMPTALIWMDFERHHETEALLRGGDEELAREDLRRLGGEVGGNPRYRIPYLRSLAALSRREGETAIEYLLEAKALSEEVGLSGESWQIHAAIGELRRERGEPEEARRAFLASAEAANALAQKIFDRNLRDNFLSAPQVRRVLEPR